MRVTKKKNLWW